MRERFGSLFGRLILVIIVVAASGPCSAQPGPETATSPASRLDALVQQLMDNAGMPGLQAVVVKNGKIVWSGAYGNAVLDSPGPRRPMRDDSQILIASTGKILVPIAVLQQMERGKLSLDDDINKYLPFSVRNPRWPDVPITWRMLLTHTSSIDNRTEEFTNSIYVFGKEHPVTFDDYMENRLRAKGRYNDSKVFRAGKPGSERIYSDDGISLAAYALERIVDESFADYVQHEIFKPLKMESTSYFLARLSVDRLSVGYVVDRKAHGAFAYLSVSASLEHKPAGGSVLDNQTSFPDYPAGRVYTTANEYARLMMMFLNGGTLDGARILSQSSVNLMVTPSSYRNLDGWNQGLGLHGPVDLHGRQLWGHDGQEPGDASAFFFNPETRIGAFAISNGNYPDFSMNYVLLDLDLHLMSCFETSD